MRRKNKRILVIVILIAAIVSFGISYNLNQDEKIKIGVLAPLTGKNIAIGEDIRNSILIALEDSNEDIELIFQDSECKPIEGVNGVRKLIEIDEVSAIVGVTCSGVAKAIAPIIMESEVPTILSVAASYNPEERGSWIFKLWPSNKERAEFEANFVKKTLNADKVGIIYVNNAFGVGLKDKFKESFDKRMFFESYNPDELDFRTQLSKIKNADVDVIFAIAYEASAVNILKQAEELGMDKQFMAVSSVISESFLNSVGDLGDGIVIDTPITKSESTSEFEVKFETKFNDKIIHPGGYFAYDSFRILADILDETQDKEKIRNQLYKVKTVGVSGEIEFDEFGKNKKKEEFKVITIKNGEFVPYN